MGRLRDRLATDLRLHGMCPVTQRAYLRCARALAAYHHRSPAALGEVEVRAFLDPLVQERRLSRGTLRVYGAALRFLSRVTLDRPDVVRRVPVPRRIAERLPDIRSPPSAASIHDREARNGGAARRRLVLPLATARSETPVAGKSVVVQDDAVSRAKRKVVLKAKDPAIVPPAPGGSGDPTGAGSTGGARLGVFNPTTREAAVVDLPAGRWRGLGTPPGAAGYEYVDSKLVDGPCKSAQVKVGILKASCKGRRVGFSLNETSQGAVGFSLVLGSEGPLCAVLGGIVRKDLSTQPGGRATFKAVDAPAPASCPLVGLADVGTLVVLGDSLRIGTTGECGDGSCPLYRALVQAALAARYGHAITVIAGATGGTTADMPAQIAALPSSLTGPVAVVVTMGGNDLLLASFEPGYPANFVQRREEMGDRIDAALDLVLAPDRFGPGVTAHVFWANFHDSSDALGGPAIPGVSPASSADVASWIQEIDDRVSGRGERLVDMYGLFLGHGLCQSGPPPAAGTWLDTDCVHMSALGEAALADGFTKAILGPY